MEGSVPYLPRYRSVSPARSRLRCNVAQPTQRIIYMDGKPSKVLSAYYAQHLLSPHRAYKVYLLGSSNKLGSLSRSSRSLSAQDLNVSHVYVSQEEPFHTSMKEAVARRAGSCEDIFNKGSFFPDLTPSESGVSVGDWGEEGSIFGAEDDSMSPNSFGSSSAFYEVTVDSDLDRLDLENLSGADSVNQGDDRTPDTVYEDGLQAETSASADNPLSYWEARKRELMPSPSREIGITQSPFQTLAVQIPASETLKQQGTSVGRKDRPQSPLAQSTPHVSPNATGGARFGHTVSTKSKTARTLFNLNISESEYKASNGSEGDNHWDISDLTISSPDSLKTNLVKNGTDKPACPSSADEENVWQEGTVLHNSGSSVVDNGFPSASCSGELRRGYPNVAVAGVGNAVRLHIPLISAGKHAQEKLKKMSQVNRSHLTGKFNSQIEKMYEHEVEELTTGGNLLLGHNQYRFVPVQDGGAAEDCEGEKIDCTASLASPCQQTGTGTESVWSGGSSSCAPVPVHLSSATVFYQHATKLQCSDSQQCQSSVSSGLSQGMEDCEWQESPVQNCACVEVHATCHVDDCRVRVSPPAVSSLKESIQDSARQASEGNLAQDAEAFGERSLSLVVWGKPEPLTQLLNHSSLSGGDNDTVEYVPSSSAFYSCVSSDTQENTPVGSTRRGPDSHGLVHKALPVTAGHLCTMMHHSHTLDHLHAQLSHLSPDNKTAPPQSLYQEHAEATSVLKQIVRGDDDHCPDSLKNSVITTGKFHHDYDLLTDIGSEASEDVRPDLGDTGWREDYDNAGDFLTTDLPKRFKRHHLPLLKPGQLKASSLWTLQEESESPQSSPKRCRKASDSEQPASYSGPEDTRHSSTISDSSEFDESDGPYSSLSTADSSSSYGREETPSSEGGESISQPRNCQETSVPHDRMSTFHEFALGLETDTFSCDWADNCTGRPATDSTSEASRHRILDHLFASLEQFNSPASESDFGERANNLTPSSQDILNSGSHSTLQSCNEEEAASRLHDLDLSRLPPGTSPTPSDNSDGSLYTCRGTAEIKKTTAKSKLKSVWKKLSTAADKPGAALHKRGIEQFEALLNDFNQATCPSSAISDVIILEEKETDDLYKAFTNEDSELQQNHACIVVEEENMSAFRFKRFLKKTHTKRKKGRKILGFLSRLSCVCETLSSPETSPNKLTDREMSPQHRISQQQYSPSCSSHSLDSAYSSISTSTSSPHSSSSNNNVDVHMLSVALSHVLLQDIDTALLNHGDGSRTSPIKSSIVLPGKAQNTASDDGIDLQDEDKMPRMNLREWDPSLVFSRLFELKLMEELTEDISHQFITMEGLMEKLPINKRKATLLKTWKRRFFRAKDGWLHYYESGNKEDASESIQLMGGIIHDLGNRMLGVDDGRGRFLMVRCPTDKEYGQWKVAMESQTADNTKATYVKPVLQSPRNTSKNVVVIDLGSTAIRAGVLGVQASLPELFMPSLVAVDRETGNVVAVGQDALKPAVRHKCKVVHPIRASHKVEQFNIEINLMEAIFTQIFQHLRINPSDFWVMVSTPQNLGDPQKKGLMEVLVDLFTVKGVCMVPQALLALYSYKATSGIIVDIGDRIEILPIFDGFVIEGGVAHCPYGGQKVQECLTTALLGNNYRFLSPVEQVLVRYIMQECCYVAQDFDQEVDWCKSNPQTMRTSVNLRNFGLPEGAYMNVECDMCRFKSPEGFFNVDMWEMDYPTLPKLVHRALQTCPMDNRRHMCRAIFLSGGLTRLPGFADRLEKELIKLAPPGVPVEVHAAPQRYHAAYIGACSVALMPQFEGMAISREEWKKEGNKAFHKWQAPSS